MKTNIGSYINRETQEVYEIFEESDPVMKPSSLQVKALPLKKHTTQLGDKVTINDEFSFKLTGSILYKI